MSRWYFWVLAPIMLAAGLGLPFIVQPPTRQGYVVLYAFSGALFLATTGLSNPMRFGWALKVVGAAILLAYLGYAESEALAWVRGKPFFGDLPKGTSFYSALRGLVVFGLPAIYFIARGRSGSPVDSLLEVDEQDVPAEDEDR
jgi:hypothetical protein